MSSKKRRPPKVRKRTKPTVREAPTARLRMAVVTSPQWSATGRVSLHGDVHLVKSALLYADEVELLGLAANLVYATGMAPGAKEPTLSELMELTEIVSSDVRLTPEIRSAIAAFEQVERRGRILPVEMRDQLDSIREFRDEAGRLLATASFGIVQDTGMEALRPALSAGIVTVTDLGLTRADTVRAVTAQSLGNQVEVQAWMDQIHLRLKDARTHLLFDRSTADLVDAMVREGEIELSAAGRLLLGKAAVGAGLVAKLPAFPEAGIDELLHLRDDLAAPLRAYRGAVVRISKTIPDIPIGELDLAVQSEWEGTVSPQLDALGSQLADHGLIRELSRQAQLDVAAYLTMSSGLFVGVDQFTEISRALAGVVSALPAAAGTVARASLARHDARKVAHRHDFYYLYATNRALAP